PEWNHRRRARAVRPVLLGGGVTPPDLVLVVEPGAIARPRAGVFDPLDEPALNGRLVVVVRLAVRPGEPTRQLRLRPDVSSPTIDHRFGLIPEDVARPAQPPLVLVGEAGALLELSELI